MGPDRSAHRTTWQCVSATQGTRDVHSERKLTHTRKQLTPHKEVEEQYVSRKRKRAQGRAHSTHGNPKDGMQHNGKEREDLEKEETELSEKDF